MTGIFNTLECQVLYNIMVYFCEVEVRAGQKTRILFWKKFQGFDICFHSESEKQLNLSEMFMIKHERQSPSPEYPHG